LLVAALSFAISSLYWLVLSLKISAFQYGELMQVQAVAQILSTVFCLRFHDLVYFIIQRYSWQSKTAFIYSFKLELLLSVLGSGISIIAIPLVFKVMVGYIPKASFSELAIVITLSNLAVMHGSATAYLRVSKQGKQIIFGDTISILIGVMGLVWVIQTDDFRLFYVLAIGLSINSLRSVYLNIWSVFHNNSCSNGRIGLVKQLNIKTLISFLFAGQLTNIVKNSLLSFETVLLSKLGQSHAIAVYRVSKSFFGITSIMLNIEYQISYTLLAKASSMSETLSAIGFIRRRATQIWMVSLMPISVVAVVYLYLNRSLEYNCMPLILLFIALASLPVALQQGEFAYLTQQGDFNIINKAYILSTVGFAFTCLLLQTLESLNLFLMVMTVAYFCRYYILRTAVRQRILENR
jgi:hypothetical protein